MGRGYRNVRATGGAVKPLPWRGQRGLGCRSKSLLMKKGLGLIEDGRVKPCINKKRRFSPFTERTSLLVRISLILIQVIPITRILRLSLCGV